MNLRLAQARDIPLLTYWDTKQHVIASGGADDVYDWHAELQRTVPWREFLIAEVDGRPVGVIVNIDPREEETHYWGDIEPNLRALDIWIGEEADLGRGYGTQMMKAALIRCFQNKNTKAIILDTLVNNTRAIKFYEKIGFKKIARKKFGEDDCYIYRIDRKEFKY